VHVIATPASERLTALLFLATIFAVDSGWIVARPAALGYTSDNSSDVDNLRV
jgi:hypothetical protein